MQVPPAHPRTDTDLFPLLRLLSRGTKISVIHTGQYVGGGRDHVHCRSLFTHFSLADPMGFTV